ncbi:MAG TPA: chromosome segregation protein SMC [Atopostipes sp.]|nr:chromosome segregation protein SMC [Atopostipes sp.]
MQLKKIILKGFKSFPEKTELTFNHGVTGIVGPNGSGKSNIIEAIRWVMGEQSAKRLRGDRMNDVIFSGTHERKPLNIAEVELILDNADGYLDIEFEEVSVLRRISRTGDSTYMINQQECRLRDISDLFMDSGLGRESFSIISQGQVEAVFNSKPEDRRGIFEEAAGVYKYKVRKQDAERKLDQTQENLDRVQDILYELEAQLEPLKKQSDIAQSYLNQKEQLTDLDVGVTVVKIKELVETIKQDKMKHQALGEKLEDVLNKIEEFERKQSKQKATLQEFEDLRDQLNQNLVEIVRKRERTEAALNLFDEKARHKEVFIHEKEVAIERLTKQNSNLEKELAEVMEWFNKETNELNRLMSELKELEEKRVYLEGDKAEQMEEIRGSYIESLQKQTSLRNEKKYLEQELSRNKRDEEKTQAHISTLREEVSTQKEKLAEKEEEYQAVSGQLLSLLNAFNEIESIRIEKKEENQRKNQRTQQTRHELERAKAKQSSLFDMQENYAGYYAGVRAIMQEKNRLEGIIGTVAELIEIPKDYLQAIDTVLGTRGQFVVVEDEKAGRSAINYLKQYKKGRATFLPITTIQSRYIPDSMLERIASLPGYIGVASELVKNKRDVQNIIDNLLGQTIVAETLESANKIARATQFRNRVVSLEGDVINAGGSMTGGGGRQNTTSPIFTQKIELDTLTKFIDQNEKVVLEMQAQQEELEEELQKLETQATTVRIQGEEMRLKEQQLKNEVEHLDTEVNRLERQLKATSFEESEQKSLLETYSKQLGTLETDLKEITERLEESNRRMELLSSEQENIDEEKEKIASSILEISEKRNDVREKLAEIRSNRQYLESQFKQNQTQITELKADIESFGTEMEVDSKEELESNLEKLIVEQSSIEKKQIEVKERLQVENKETSVLSEQLQKLNGRQQYLAEERSKLAVELSRNDVRMDHSLNYLVDEYKIGFEEAKLLETPDISLEEAQKKVRLLKKGIEELGPVNLNSVAEYEHVNERYTFLSKQQNDLIDAKVQLYHTMDEMDAIVEKQFEETFIRIQEEFAKVFPKMFGGGYAELVLNQPDNLLETGIEIIAQPPGKRLTRLSLLSGGERALTAISLLFAIIQVNPVPFCILDEAEAALDDANVIRFGRYLEEFEGDTQFIVITHRKGTMEHANQLYGVTMQEKGISKIVSVSLNEAQAIDGVT